jgi:hypothetical protein
VTRRGGPMRCAIWTAVAGTPLWLPAKPPFWTAVAGTPLWLPAKPFQVGGRLLSLVVAAAAHEKAGAVRDDGAPASAAKAASRPPVAGLPPQSKSSLDELKNLFDRLPFRAA